MTFHAISATEAIQGRQERNITLVQFYYFLREPFEDNVPSIYNSSVDFPKHIGQIKHVEFGTKEHISFIPIYSLVEKDVHFIHVQLVLKKCNTSP